MTRVATALFALLVGLISQASLATNYSDWWADSSLSGSSINISQQGNSLGLAWYFYDSTGNPTWIFGGGALSGATASVTLLRASGVTLGAPTSVSSVAIGTATITFTSDSAATFAFNYSGTSAYLGRTGQMSLKRFTLAALPLAGTFQYASKIVTSGCTDPSNNGTTNLTGTLVSNPNTSTKTITVTDTPTGLTAADACTFSGPYEQNGSKISSTGTFNCFGLTINGRLDVGVTDDTFQATTTIQLAGVETCRVSLAYVGIRQ